MLPKLNQSRFVFLLLFIGLLFLVSPDLESEPQIVIIANNKVVTDYLTIEDIRNIYLGITTKWPDRSSIYFAILSPDVANADLHDAFTRKFVGKTSGQFEMYWRYQLFTGKRKMPPMCKNEEKMVEFVEKQDGSIGYISPSVTLKNVKVITIVEKMK